jgi:hypothetical protein
MTAAPIGPESRSSSRCQTYRLARTTLASDIHLPELERTDQTAAWHFTVALRPHENEQSFCHWFHRWTRPSGELWLMLGQIDDCHLLRFPGLADFYVYLDQRSIRCVPCPNLPPSTVRHLLLDQVFPLALSNQRQIVMHASAVVTPQGAIVFTAASGSGKSTLATYLGLTGFPMLTDDCLLVEVSTLGPIGTALYSGVRLLPDSFGSLFGGDVEAQRLAHYTEKLRVCKSDGSACFHSCVSAPIVRIYFLSPTCSAPGSPSITSVSGAEALLALMQSSFVMDARNPDTLRNQFDCLQIAAAQPIFRRISFAHDFDALAEVRRAIEKDLQQ